MKNVNEMSSKELKNLAKENKISGWWKMNKAQLVEALSNKYNKFKEGLQIKTPLLIAAPVNKIEDSNDLKETTKKSWFEGLDYNTGDILYLIPDKKFGEFQEYGKRKNRLWSQMWKKNSRKPMSRTWALIKEETIVAFKLINGEYVNQNPELFKMGENNIPQLITK